MFAGKSGSFFKDRKGSRLNRMVVTNGAQVIGKVGGRLIATVGVFFHGFELHDFEVARQIGAERSNTRRFPVPNRRDQFQWIVAA